MNGNEISNSALLKSRSTTAFAVAGAVLGNPIKDVLEIGERLVVENEIHPARYEPSRAMRSRASAWDTSLRLGSALRRRTSATCASVNRMSRICLT